MRKDKELTEPLEEDSLANYQLQVETANKAKILIRNSKVPYTGTQLQAKAEPVQTDSTRWRRQEWWQQ